MHRFEGRRIVLTGAATGIGRAIADRFAAEGARVAALDIVPIDDPDGRFERRIQVDVADAAAVARAFDEVDAAFGGVDVAVNVAGILRLGPMLDVSVEEWHRVLDVNALGTLLVMQHAARRMIAAGGGRIVNMASMAAKQGGDGEAAYTASKAAVVALTRVGAIEWGPHGVTVNAICPGYVLTELGAATRTDDDVRRWSALSPLGRLGEADDVAGLALFLASDDAAYMTGQAINITGGMAMH